jgi:ADP-heptose:LPS heptosyltransferase
MTSAVTVLPSAPSDVGPLRALPSPQRIAVFRALQLGDMLCAVPALRALRASYPRAEIVLVGLPWSRELVHRFDHYLDGHLEFPGYPGLPEQPVRARHVPFFLREAQRREFDLVLQMHGSGRITNPLVALLGARRYAGFREEHGFCTDDEALFLPWPEHGSEIHRLLRLMTFLGVTPDGEHLEFPIHDTDREAIRTVPALRSLAPGEYVCIHPGARRAEKRWPPEQFAAVADALAARGLRIVLTGTAAEAPLTRAVAAAMRERPIDAAGPMHLGALPALMADARLIICNDTGVSHLAAAIGVPSVVIFLAADPDRWAPLDAHRHRAIYDPITCQCHAAGRTPGRACPDGITPPIVLAEAEPLLNAGRAYAA